ncbi:MAG: PrgI family protein [Candidatus Saccharimonadales bacterium]
MAVYKVPQDVEADDKLIGPFSFRQFIYLIIVAISGAAAWGLSQLFIPLAIIPLPFIIFFAALALPLRKDQPMETYLSAVVSFYFLKSRRRFWQPDGIDSFVTIIPPKEEGIRRIKDIDEDEATRRLGYLADLVDSHGWSVRGQGVPAPDTSLNRDLYYESQPADDMMDTDNAESARLTQGLAAASAAARHNAEELMHSSANMPPTPTAPPTPTPILMPQPLPAPAPTPETGQAHIISDQRDAVTYATLLIDEAEESRNEAIPHTPTPQSTSTITTPDDTIERAKEYAKMDDVSVETLSTLANREEQKPTVQKNTLDDGDEVTISLR